jgi:hypothetical protein
MVHTLSDNLHGLIDSAVVTLADGYAELKGVTSELEFKAR